MYGPPHDCKKKPRARRQVCANVFGLYWRSVLLAMMSCAHVCPYKSVGNAHVASPEALSICGPFLPANTIDSLRAVPASRGQSAGTRLPVIWTDDGWRKY